MKKTRIASILIFLLTLSVSQMMFAQDSTLNKLSFGFHGNMNVFYDKINYYGNQGIGSYSSYKATGNEVNYAPSLDFFMQSKRFYFELGLLHFGYKNEKTEDNNYGTITKGSIHEFGIQYKIQLNYLLINPQKYFISPYIGLGVMDMNDLTRTTLDSYANAPSGYTTKESINELFAFVNVGFQKNIKKNMFVRLEALNSYYSKYNEKDTYVNGKESVNTMKEYKFKFTYLQLGFGVLFK